MLPIPKDDKKWYVIIAKTVHHKKAAASFEKLRMSYYLPLQRQLHYCSDRKKWITIPILNPYIFLYKNESERKIIFQSSVCFNFLHIGGQPAIAKRDEIEKVKFLCNYSASMKIEPSSIKKGNFVEETWGPFLGMKGYTLQENGKHRFLIHILSLGHFASIDMGINSLEPLY